MSVILKGALSPAGAAASQGALEDRVAPDRRRLIMLTSASVGTKTPIDRELVVIQGRINALISPSDLMEPTLT
ncbi:hypothetical protein M514_13357, partial [Trichuris suis]